MSEVPLPPPQSTSHTSKSPARRKRPVPPPRVPTGNANAPSKENSATELSTILLDELEKALSSQHHETIAG